MDWKKTGPLVAVAAVGFGLVGCGVEGPQSGVGDETVTALQPGNVLVSNDRAALEARVTRNVRALTVAPKGTSTFERSDKPQERQLGVRLTQVASMASPVVDGLTVQANDIDIHGHLAVVSYNMAGDVFAGAVQVIDFSRPSRPELVSEVLYRQADANAVAMHGSELFVGLASGDPVLPTPALMEKLNHRGEDGLAQSGDWLALPSWAVTDLAVKGDEVLVAVGARDGGIARVSRNHLGFERFMPANDLRGVALNSNGAISVCGGQSAKMVTHGLPSLLAEVETSLSGYSGEFAKGTVEWSSNRVYLGTGNAGFQVRSETGALLDQLASSAFSDHAGNPGVVNAVSVDRHLAFVAAGPGGVQVVRLGRYRCDGRESEENEGLRVLGQLDLEDGASSNMVKARNDVLVVAAGLGGVKIVTMEYID